jgi:hypothetical protein
MLFKWRMESCDCDPKDALIILHPPSSILTIHLVAGGEVVIVIVIVIDYSIFNLFHNPYPYGS